MEKKQPAPKDTNNDSCPVGTIVAYAGSITEPLSMRGWDLCKGTEMSRADYYELFAVIGTTYGGDEAKKTFRLPNLQGYFIRGLNDTKDGPDKGRALGTEQKNAFEKHKHQWRGYHRTTATAIGNTSRADSWIEGDPEADITNEKGTADETRPDNFAMNYIIKSKSID